jgi:hypothetical protein
MTHNQPLLPQISVSWSWLKGAGYGSSTLVIQICPLSTQEAAIMLGGAIFDVAFVLRELSLKQGLTNLFLLIVR